MKIIKYLTFILAAATLLCGCNKRLDIQLDDRVEDQESVYSRLSRVYDHLRMSFYTPVTTSVSNGFSAGGFMMAGYCDEAQEVAQGSVVYDWYNGRVSASSMPLWYTEQNSGTERWAGMFHCINECNTALYWLLRDDLAIDYEEAQREGLIAQFYALRGFCYLHLIKRWGGVPIIDKPIGAGYDYSQDRRASFAQCVDFIIESCDAALATTDKVTADGYPWFPIGSNNWQVIRLGRAATWAIKSQAALYAASPLWAEDYDGTQKYTWERAAAICKEALDQALGHGAELVTMASAFPIESDFGLNAYDKYFLSPYQPDGWEKETLYQPYNYGYYRSVVWQYSGLPIDAGQSSAGACPTQEMVDAYEVLSADGLTAVPLLNLSNPYNTDGTPNFNPEALTLGYEEGSEKMYANRDPRFYSTIYYDGAVVELDNEVDYTVETAVGGNCGLTLSPSNRRNTCTGYYLRKFGNARSSAQGGNMDGYIRALRLAELYLNFAEAAFHAYDADYRMPATTVVENDSEGNPQTVTYGTAMSARDAVNTIRARVGMPGITVSGNDFRLRMCNERRIELAFEEHRFFDVRRWTSPDGDLSATDRRVSGMRIEGNGAVKTYTRFSYDRKCYTNKYLKYPIGIDEVSKMLSHTGENWQNDGWN